MKYWTRLSFISAGGIVGLFSLVFHKLPSVVTSPLQPAFGENHIYCG